MVALYLPGPTGPIVVAGRALSPTTFDFNRINAKHAYSGGNLTATTNGGGLVSGIVAKSVAGYHTGRLYCEFTLVHKGGSDGAGFGLLNEYFHTLGTGAPLGVANTYLGQNTDGIGAFDNSGSYFNNVNIGNIGTFTDGDILSLAVDLNTREMWARINSGLWNATGGADPATNTSGTDISALRTIGNAIHAAIEGYFDATVWTANFGATPYAHTVPTGYSNWLAYPPVRLDPLNKSANQTLSGGNLVVTGGGGATVGTVVRSAIGRSRFSVLYAEVTLTNLSGPGGFAVGICNNAYVIDGGDFLGKNAFSASLNDYGQILINNTNPIVTPALTTGDIIRLAINRESMLMHWAINGASWDNDSLDHPEIDTGGVDISGITGEIFLAIETSGVGTVATVNFGETPFAYPPPEYFNNWSQATCTAWDPLETSANVTRSNGDLTLQANTGTANGDMSRSIAHHASGEYYNETVIDVQPGPGECAVGIANSSAALTDSYPGIDANSVVYSETGDIIGNGDQILVSTGVTYGLGDRIGTHVDATGKTVRFRKNGGSWSAAADISFITGDLYFVGYVYKSGATGSKLTTNFGYASFTDPPPYGSTIW